MFRRKSHAAAAAAVALALTLTACGGSSSSTTSSSAAAAGSGSAGSGSAASGGTLTLGLLVPATTFSAADMNFANESPYGQAVYDTLLKADPTGKLGPDLATVWTYDAKKTVLRMTLRSDVVFTDGTKFTADVAAQNLTRFRDGNSPNKSFLASLKEAKAVDATHLQLTLTQADPGFLNYLAENAGMQESPAAFKAADIKTNPIGSGPYILDTKNTVIGTSYAFTKNPKYWDPSSVHYNSLVLKVLADPTAMLNAIKGNQLNGAKLANNDGIAQIKAAGYTVTPFELDWTGMLLLDRAGKTNPALKDVRVRQAINYAFDTAGLLKAYGKGFGTVTTQVFPTSSPAYDKALDTRYAYDPAKAKALLAAAGYANGLTLNMPSTSLAAPSLFTLIAQQLKDVGITAKFTDTGNNFIADVLAPKYPVAWLQLQQDPDWQLINFEITPTSTFNPFKYDDPKVDALVKTIHDATSDTASTAALKQLNAYIVEQAWFAPWFRVQSNYATDAKTKVVPQVGNAYPYLWNFTPAS